jgi:predicted nucleotidyltransferase
MKVTAIIAEYNPLHKGHAMHIKKAREETCADYIIAVMSGDYVQRGTPAIISKYVRANCALSAGADLVLELPLCYSCGSLDFFSFGAVSLIQKTGITDCISFGSECGDINILKRAADLTSNINGAQENELRDLLSTGISYSNAINTVCKLPDDIAAILNKPNNLLGTAYIRAASSLSFNGIMHTIKRTGDDYHDGTPGALSSTSLRNEMTKTHGSASVSDRMPEDVHSLVGSYLDSYPVLTEDDLSLILFYRLNSLLGENGYEKEKTIKALTSYLDVTDSLAGKILNKFKHASSFSDLCRELKSRDLNYARISRALLHIILGIDRESVDEYRTDGFNYYIKPLAFKKDSDILMHELKKNARIPLITKNADADRILKNSLPAVEYTRAIRMFNEGMAASDLYNKTACTKGGRSFISEPERSPAVI